MAFTRGSMVFRCTLEQVAEIATLADLRHEITEGPSDSYYPHRGDCEQWQDVQTGGGGCRLTWKEGVVWVTCHGGYPHADMTQEVADLFRYMGCKEADGYDARSAHPTIYGVREWRENIGYVRFGD